MQEKLALLKKSISIKRILVGAAICLLAFALQLRVIMYCLAHPDLTYLQLACIGIATLSVAYGIQYVGIHAVKKYMPL